MSDRPPWRAVLTHPRYERRVGDELKARGFAVYVPSELAWVKHGKKREQLRRPIIPGHVLAYVADEDIHAVRRIYGVRGFIQVNGEPGRVPEAFVTKLRLAEALSDFFRLLSLRIREHRTERRQAQKRLRGQFVRLHAREGMERVRLLLDAMGARRTDAELEPEQWDMAA